jgi:hypothetical protein
VNKLLTKDLEGRGRSITEGTILAFTLGEN